VAGFVFNISRGKAAEYHARVDGNDPANSALILVVLRAAALESDALLRDYDTLSAILAGASDEATNTNYARKTLTDADISAGTVDDTNDRVTLTYATQTWTSVAAGDSWAKLLVCYDSDTTAGTDANIVPVTAHDMLISGAAVIPSGANIVWSVPSGYYVSSA
jgi:hypothetical protein